jgi:membrane peptidoglycan carboxypeptidase
VTMGIGQDKMQVTPLQIANAMCIVANKGSFYIPHFVERVDGESPDDSILDKYRQKHSVLNHISDADYETVISGMQDVTDIGTGRIARIPGINICSKTGTAETYLSLEGRRTKLNNNSIFVCFAPRENPQIVVAVVVQNAGFGAKWAAPMGSFLLEKYLRDTLTAERVKQATVIANTNLVPGYFVRLQFLTDSLRGEAWAKQTGDSSRLKKFLDRSLRREMLDTLNRQSVRVTIPFGPRPKIATARTDSTKQKIQDSLQIRKGEPARVRKTDSLTLRRTDSLRMHGSDSLKQHHTGSPVQTTDSLKPRRTDTQGVHKNDSAGAHKPNPAPVHKPDSTKITGAETRVEEKHLSTRRKAAIAARNSAPVSADKEGNGLAIIPEEQKAVQKNGPKNKIS